jgi:hypothetical protein
MVKEQFEETDMATRQSPKDRAPTVLSHSVWVSPLREK